MQENAVAATADAVTTVLPIIRDRQPAPDVATLDAIQRRVLWLATNMIHHANHLRPNPDGSKIGGHQASSASVVST